MIKHKPFILVGVPLLFFSFVLVIITLLPEVNPTPSETTPSPTISSPNQQVIFNEELVEIGDDGDELEEPLENRPGFTGTETLPDATTMYSFLSHIPERPNIIITRGGHDFVFQRNLTLPEFPVRISDYISVDGPPGWVFQGSNFYGDGANTYIYPQRGVAFIANPDTDEVFEQHLFEPMAVEEYVRKYGEDIPANPEP